MAVGIILRHSQIKPAASFYVPCESFAQDRVRCGLNLACSHILLEIDPLKLLVEQVEAKLHWWSHLAPKNVLFIVPIPSKLVGTELGLLGDNLVLLVPVVDSPLYWSELRRLSKRHRLILSLERHVLLEMVRRYKCLPYDAVVATSATVVSAEQMLSKRSRPHLLMHQAEAREEVMDLFASCSCPHVSPHSDELIDPLQPLTRDLSLEVYQTFEKDKVKYAQYDGAIQMAVADLRALNPTIRILVIGPGRGPLLDMVIKHACNQDTVVAIERNVNCIETLKARLKERKLLKLIHGDVRDVHDTFDIVVSELLGSFGCNEACPEILQHFTDAHTVMIPQAYTSYLQPAYCEIFEEFHAGRPFLANFNSIYFTGTPVHIFEFIHPGTNKLDQTSTFEINLSPTNPCNALVGFFEAQLYGSIRIGITPRMNHHELCTSWYPMVFPVGLLELRATVTFSRRSSATSLWYQWKVNEIWFNSDSSKYLIDL